MNSVIPAEAVIQESLPVLLYFAFASLNYGLRRNDPPEADREWRLTDPEQLPKTLRIILIAFNCGKLGPE